MSLQNFVESLGKKWQCFTSAFVIICMHLSLRCGRSTSNDVITRPPKVRVENQARELSLNCVEDEGSVFSRIPV